MHEYPMTCQIIKIAEKYVRDEKRGKVTEIGLVVGDYSGFIGDSIQMYFDEISKGTKCEGAVLTIRHIKPKWRCTKCKELFERKLLSFECPTCQGIGEPTEIGKEFYIEYIECCKEE